jgi:hypothetical protein
VQQQNEIASLTDEIVRLQNETAALKKQLSTRKHEEEDM